MEIKLKDESEGGDEIFYEKKPLFKLTIKPDISALELKQ